MDTLFGPPPPDGNQDRDSVIYGAYWTFFGLGLLFICLRFYARIKIHALGWDDWTMAFTMLIFLGELIVGTFLVQAGGCRHLYYLVADGGLDAVIKVTRLFYICQPFAIMSLAVGRTSVAMLILRFMGLSVWRKRFLWFSIVSTVLVSTLNSIMLFTACSPVEGIWNPTIPAKCWDPAIMVDVTIFSSSWNVFMDICLALLPISIFWNLQLSLKKRIGLSALMSGGVLAAISGAMKTAKLKESIDSDVTWATFDLFIWNLAETTLIIICGCIPTLRPLYDMWFGHRSTSIRPSYERRLNTYISGNHDTHHRLRSSQVPSLDSDTTKVPHPVHVAIREIDGKDSYSHSRQNDGQLCTERRGSHFTEKSDYSGGDVV